MFSDNTLSLNTSGEWSELPGNSGKFTQLIFELSLIFTHLNFEVSLYKVEFSQSNFRPSNYSTGRGKFSRLNFQPPSYLVLSAILLIYCCYCSIKKEPRRLGRLSSQQY